MILINIKLRWIIILKIKIVLYVRIITCNLKMGCGYFIFFECEKKCNKDAWIAIKIFSI